MRKLKYHEKKVLKKSNFLEWKREGGQQMDPTDPFRIQMTDMLLDKLRVLPTSVYNLGALTDRLPVSSFCRRRLSTVLVHLKVLQYNDKLDDYDMIA
ncbi:unnamed protein product [Brassica oleracea]